MRNLTIALLVCAVVLSGCDSRSGHEPTEPSAEVPRSAPAPVAVTTKVVSDNGMLTVDPAVIDACTHPDGVVASDISWNATSAGTEGVEVFLQGPEGDRKLWSAAGAVAGDRTGPWMREGSEVILVNGSDKKELARIAITSQACAR